MLFCGVNRDFVKVGFKIFDENELCCVLIFSDIFLFEYHLEWIEGGEMVIYHVHNTVYINKNIIDEG